MLLTARLGVFAQSPARKIMDEMIQHMGMVVSASARVKRMERLPDGSMISGEMEFKAMFRPSVKAYVRIKSPREGTEVLYVEGWNDNEAYINTNGFPWINVSLDPQGSTMMEKQHHSLLCIGFKFTEGVVRNINKDPNHDFDDHVTYLGVQKWSNRSVHVVKIEYPEFGPVKYTVQGDENLCQIERKIFVPAAKILDMNPGMDDYWDLKPGQVINVPNYYGKESIFMIDTENYMPIVQIVNDEKGLFEKYEYHDLKINPKFTTTEFTKDFPGYGF
jgi:LysM repeat protein